MTLNKMRQILNKDTYMFLQGNTHIRMVTSACSCTHTTKYRRTRSYINMSQLGGTNMVRDAHARSVGPNVGLRLRHSSDICFHTYECTTL